MRAAILLVCAMVLASCTGRPEPDNRTPTEKYEVRLLFEQDGCKVYRFWDGGRRRHFANCPGATISTTQSRSNGKTTTTWDENVPTGEVPQ